MKYKNIILKESEDSEAELLVDVNYTVSTEIDEDDYCDELVDKLYELFDNSKYDLDIDSVAEGLIQVRSGDFTFDKDGLSVLKRVYNKIDKAIIENIVVKIAVHVEVMFGLSERIIPNIMKILCSGMNL